MALSDEEDQLWTQYLEYSSPSSSSSSEEPYLLGFVIVNIVGLRYYSGTITKREMVGLVREPLNPHDPNAIKVLNARAAQVGHIERTAAAVLAPLLDSRLVAAVEGIVPQPPRNPNPYRLPCQAHIFSFPSNANAVRAAVDRGGLQLIDVENPGFGLSEAVIVQERNSKAGKKDKSVDEIFALISKGEAKLVPIEPPKEVIASDLFSHQKEGLGWLIGRENSCDLPPFWEERGGMFINVLTNHQTRERPEPLRGGILADDMGLGKTLTLLSLIATNRPGRVLGSSIASLEEKGEELGSSGSKRKAKLGQKAVGSRKSRKLESGKEVYNGPRTTLIVCPKSVLSSWITQLEEHTRSGSFKVYLYHQERTKKAKELLSFDIVLTTYNTLAAEFGSSNSLIQEIEWLRVILDEAHVIKNAASKQAKATIGLKAERRWLVTGTPIQNSSSDLFSLMAFLRFQPFSIKSYWQSLVQRPLNQGNKNGLLRLQALMGAISLRRTKDMQSDSKCLVGLPPKVIETCFLELSAEEREFYDQVESVARSTVQEYIDAGTVMRNYSTILHIILRLRQICDNMALCPPDIRSLLPSNTLEDVSQHPELLRKFSSMVEDGDDFDCPVCLTPPNKTVITSCAHIFCRTCIMKILKHVNALCPICRHPLSESELFLVPNDGDKFAIVPPDQPISSKVSALLKLLLSSKEENPARKSVVFSQFRKMLILLEGPLKAAGFAILRLDGQMDVKKRTEVIGEFGKHGPGTPTVLLASLKAAGTGVNLTAASRVYLVDPWWNPGVEEQAMDRVHRIGQQEEVRVVRLIVKDSIEERILELQDKKKKLATGAFGKKAAEDQVQMRIEEIRLMMHL